MGADDERATRCVLPSNTLRTLRSERSGIDPQELDVGRFSLWRAVAAKVTPCHNCVPAMSVAPASAPSTSTSTSTSSPPEANGLVFTAGFWLLLAVQTAFGLGFSTFLLLPKFLTVELTASAKEIGLVTAISSIAGVLMFP